MIERKNDCGVKLLKGLNIKMKLLNGKTDIKYTWHHWGS